jgi:hypothetical protein
MSNSARPKSDRRRDGRGNAPHRSAAARALGSTCKVVVFDCIYCDSKHGEVPPDRLPSESEFTCQENGNKIPFVLHWNKDGKIARISEGEGFGGEEPPPTSKEIVSMTKPVARPMRKVSPKTMRRA